MTTQWLGREIGAQIARARRREDAARTGTRPGSGLTSTGRDTEEERRQHTQAGGDVAETTAGGDREATGSGEGWSRGEACRREKTRRGIEGAGGTAQDSKWDPGGEKSSWCSSHRRETYQSHGEPNSWTRGMGLYFRILYIYIYVLFVGVFIMWVRMLWNTRVGIKFVVQGSYISSFKKKICSFVFCNNF